MTWPFENDTSAVVKRISNRSISANRKRNLFTINHDCSCSSTVISNYALWIWDFTSNYQPNKRYSTNCIHKYNAGTGRQVI